MISTAIAPALSGNRQTGKPKPAPRQLEYQDWEFGIFIHFGIRTFFEGHKDFDGITMPAEKFNPAELDCEQWARTAVRAGAKFMVFTAKHHDGFANWPSKFTGYSVAKSSWRDGKGDVVKEYVDACRKHNLKVGIYYSPADVGCPFYEEPEKYDRYFISQLSELLDGRYGDIDLLWLDGCGSQGHNYNWKAITATIRRMQPGILIHNLGEPDYRWCGNEEGIGPVPVWNTVDESDRERLKEISWKIKDWLPVECPCRIREKNWFYSDNDLDTLKTVDELLGIYYYSIGRGCNLLLNVAPDRRGGFPEPDTEILAEFGHEIRTRFASPVADFSKVVKTGENEWTFKFDKRTCANHILIMEELTEGESIKKFRLEVNYRTKGTFWPIYEGSNVGHKAICRFPEVGAENFIFRVTEADGPVKLRDLSIHKI